MDEKYNLQQLLEEIEEDRLSDRSEKRKMAQGQIQELITQRKKAVEDASADRQD